MNDSTRDNYIELLGLAQLHLLHDYGLRDWISVDPTSFQYFKEFALQHRKPQPLCQPQVEHVKRNLNTEGTENTEKGSRVESVSKKPTQVVIAQQDLTAKGAKDAKNKEKTVKEKQPQEIQTEKKLEEATKRFVLQPAPPVSQPDFHDVRKIYQDKFPGQAIAEQVPNDNAAIKIQTAWKYQFPPVILLTAHISPDQENFIHNLANAIHTKILPAKVVDLAAVDVEALLNATTIKLLVAPHSLVQSSPTLHKHYREDSGKFFIGRIPLCQLVDIDQYLKNPQLKIPLWNVIKQLLSHGA